MALIPGQCSACGVNADWRVAQAIGLQNTLMWSRSMTCGRCGVTIEEDSEGMPPAWAREALLSQQGESQLIVVDEAEKRRAVTELRALLSIDLQTAAKMLRARASPLWSGTRVECTWLVEHLKRLGIETMVREVPGL